MLFVIIILLCIIAAVSIGLNITYFKKMKALAAETVTANRAFDNACMTIRKLRVGNRRLTDILRDRDLTIKNMGVMFEDTMDLPKDGEDPEKWRERLLKRHRSDKLIVASTMGPRNDDSSLLQRILEEDPEKGLKKLATPVVFHNMPEEDQDLEDLVNHALWDRANPNVAVRNREDIPVPHFEIKEDGTINQLRPIKAANDSVLEANMDLYLKRDKEMEIGTEAHQVLEKIPGADLHTTVMPALEPLSLEEKKE